MRCKRAALEQPTGKIGVLGVRLGAALATGYPGIGCDDLTGFVLYETVKVGRESRSSRGDGTEAEKHEDEEEHLIAALVSNKRMWVVGLLDSFDRMWNDLRCGNE